MSSWKTLQELLNGPSQERPGDAATWAVLVFHKMLLFASSNIAIGMKLMISKVVILEVWQCINIMPINWLVVKDMLLLF